MSEHFSWRGPFAARWLLKRQDRAGCQSVFVFRKGEGVYIDRGAGAGDKDLYELFFGDLADRYCPVGAAGEEDGDAGVGREDYADVVGVFGVEAFYGFFAAAFYIFEYRHIGGRYFFGAAGTKSARSDSALAPSHRQYTLNPRNPSSKI